MKSKRKPYVKIFSIGLIIVLVALLCIFYFFLWSPEEVRENILVKPIVYNDRINPYIYQGVTVEILRMRNRGILESIIPVGVKWKHPPTYYFIVEVDGEIGNASTIEAAGGIKGEGTFTVWDTFFKECRTNFKVSEEDQKTSDVTITIMEIQLSGLFKRKEHHVEKLSIDLVFDYRTGHWSGDDFLQDPDGYGHVLGEDYELWFNIYQSDYDHDMIPYWTEVNIYRMDPTVSDGDTDLDGDGIPSWWEWKYGYDPLTWDNHKMLDPDIDGVENTEEYMLADFLSNPFYPDVYVEVDFMKKNPHTLFDLDHVMHKESQQMIIEKMATFGISVYFDDGWADGPINGGGEYVDFVETIEEMVGGHMARFYKHHFNDERKGVFRYLQIVNNAGVITASEFNTYDHILMDSSPLKVYTRHFAFTDRLKRVMQAKGILHEMGHTMGLVPGAFVGIDNMPQNNNRWPETLTQEEWKQVNVEYRSIMNYNFVFPWSRNFIEDFTFFDFSDGTNGNFDFNDFIHFYLPTFEMDASILESPTIETFEDIEWVDKDPEPIYNGWYYDENLTNILLSDVLKMKYDINNAVSYDYRIYLKEDLDQQGRFVRIYTKPNVKPIPALWSLIAEGDLEITGQTLTFYSFDMLFEDIINRIDNS